MSRWLLLSLLISGTALANGRAPGTSTIHFQPGHETNILAGMTFGALKSHDGGATWTWQCEEAVGYGGLYDPVYGFTPTGTLFATTFNGLNVNTDGCVYAPTVLAPPAPAVKFFSTLTVGPDGSIYAAAADPTDDKIYKSTNDGQSFNVSTEPGQLNDWWQTIAVAPSDPTVVYLTGYRLTMGQPKKFLLLRSGNGGTSFTPLPGNATASPPSFAVMANSTIEIVGINKTNPNLVYGRVTLSDNMVSDAIYRSTDGGQSWTKILEKQGAIAFVARANGELVAGTQVLGTFKATDPGAGTPSNQITFTEVTGAPHINCLSENTAGEVWACTQNYGSPTVPSDGFGIMKTTNLTTWTGVVKFQDIKEPDVCPAGTKQKDRCDVQLWCGLCAQLGCNPGRDCAAGGDGSPVDATPVQPKSTGWCQAGNDGIPGLMVLAIAFGVLMLRRNRAR